MSNLSVLEKVRNDRLLKGVSLQVFEILAEKPGLTVGEIAWQYNAKKEDPTALGRSRGELSKRVSELVAKNVIRAEGKTLCPFTGRKANRYVPTGGLPEPVKLVVPVEPLSVALPITSPRASNATVAVLHSFMLFCMKVETRWYLPTSVKKRASALITAINEVLSIV